MKMSDRNSTGLKRLVVVAQIGLLALAPPVFADTAKVYVADEESSTVSVIDAASFKKIGSIAVGLGPHNVQVSPDGKMVWVTNNGEPVSAAEKMPSAGVGAPGGGHSAMPGSGAVWAIDAATDAVVAKVPVCKDPAHVVVTSDGRFAYVANGGDNSISLVDTAAQRVVATIPVGAMPHGMRLRPGGKEAWVANLGGATVSVIDTRTRKQVARIAVGQGPAQVGFTPDGRLGFVSLSKEDRVAVIDPASRKVLRKVAVGAVPIQLYATPDSRLLLVANQGSREKPGKTVSIIDLVSFKSVATIETGLGAHGVVIDHEGRQAFVTNTYVNTVSVIDIAERKVIATVPVGRGPNGVSVTP
jgi:YVTN family beta-propeller protein